MYNIYYTYVPLDKLESGLEQEISFIEECISCKNKYVFCLKYDLFRPGTLCKYGMWTYYLKIIAVWKSPVLLLRPLQNVGTDSFCSKKKGGWIVNWNDTLIILNMQGILKISILFRFYIDFDSKHSTYPFQNQFLLLNTFL